MIMGTNKKEARENTRAYASKLAADEHFKRLGVKLDKLDRLAEEGDSSARYPTELKIKMLYDDRGNILAVIKADGPEGPQVAFHGGETITEALGGIVSRWDNGTLKWKEDKPYGTT